MEPDFQRDCSAAVCGRDVLRVAYTLQIIGQKNLDPTVASLILSLESAVSVLAGWFILGQALTVKELFGCALVFAAVIWVQMPSPSARISRKYKPKNE